MDRQRVLHGKSIIEGSPVKLHGVDAAFYANTPFGFKPVIECLCQWSTGRCESWEEAGRELDEHLKAA